MPKRTRWIVLVVALLLLPVLTEAAAVGTVVVTSTQVRDLGHRYQKYVIAWTCSSGGIVSGNAFTVMPGRLVSLRFTPNTSSTQPSDQYDLTLLETGGVADIALAQGANLSNANVTLYEYTVPIFQDGSRTLDVVIANAGNAKTGTVELLIETQ